MWLINKTDFYVIDTRTLSQKYQKTNWNLEKKLIAFNCDIDMEVRDMKSAKLIITKVKRESVG